MFRSITVPPIISRMSDRGTRGREEKASLKPANHRERRAPIVRGAITRVDEKKGDHIEERERKREEREREQRAVTRRGYDGTSNK